MLSGLLKVAKIGTFALVEVQPTWSSIHPASLLHRQPSTLFELARLPFGCLSLTRHSSRPREQTGHELVRFTGIRGRASENKV